MSIRCIAAPLARADCVANDGGVDSIRRHIAAVVAQEPAVTR